MEYCPRFCPLATGNVEAITAPDGKITRFEYDVMDVGRMRAAERIGEQQQGDDLWVGGGGQ